MTTVLNRIFLRPMSSVFVRINRKKTPDTSPSLSGTYGRLRGEIPVSIELVINGNAYNATVLPGGRWELADNLINPALVTGTIYDVTATATFPGGETVNDRTTDELEIENELVAYEAGPNTDIAYGSSATGVAYGFKL